MARDRKICQSFWSSESISELSLHCRLMFIGMWNFCDDSGVHPASFKKIKMEIFPADEISCDQISKWIDELIKQKLIIEYQVEDKKYWRCTGWNTHQTIKFPSFKHPLEDGTVPTAVPRKKEVNKENSGTCTVHVENMIPPEHQNLEAELPQEKRREEKRREEKLLKKTKQKKETEIAVVEPFVLTAELIAWGGTLPQIWTPDEMKLHFDYFCNYLTNRTAKPYKNLKRAFQNAVIGNYARLQRQLKSFDEQRNERNEQARQNFLRMAQEDSDDEIKHLE